MNLLLLRAGTVLIVLCGCDRDAPPAPLTAARGELRPEGLTQDMPESPRPPPITAPSTTTPVPRRGYGPIDMKFAPCTTRESDTVIVGRGCSSSIVVYGPYVSAPANSDVEVTFRIEAKTRVALVSDIVSNSAQNFHGGLLEHVLEAGMEHAIGYKVHLFRGVDALESRIFVRADAPADFRIKDLVVNVR